MFYRRTLYLYKKENFMEHIIYKLTSPNGKIYIGRTCNFDDRMAQHKYESTVTRRNYPLYKAIRKYGWENFTKEIIVKNLNQETAELLEEILIKQFNSVKIGYNSSYNTTGGGNVWVDKPETEKDEFRKKMSELTVGDKNGMYGKKQTDEAKQKQREKAKGRFSLQWYIDRHGDEQGTLLHKQRSEHLRKRNLVRNQKGVFVSPDAS